MPGPADAPTSRIIGHYRLSSKLGQGGMGEVWQATDTRLGREVAVKILPDAVAANPERAARFEREAKILASLNHPGIAAIYGVEKNALVMELVEGETLAEKLRSAVIPVPEALLILSQIVEALAYAHDKGVVHRDLKPANIKITSEGQVKILDFGLAKAISAESTTHIPTASEILNAPTMSAPNLAASSMTREGVIMGTAAYMAPEQARGQNVDRRADIWAFGVMAYELLTGERPFGGPTMSDTLAAILTLTPDWEKLPARARRMTQACLEKEPKKRLRDISDSLLLLEAVPGPATPAAPPPRGLAMPAALALLLMMTGLAVWGWWRWWNAFRPAAYHFTAVTNFAGVQAQPSVSPDGRSVAFISNQDGNFNLYVGLIGGGSLVQLTHGRNLKAHPAWSPEGTETAYARLDRHGVWSVWEIPALGGTAQRIISHAMDPSFSRHGRHMVYTNMTDGSIWIASSTGENARQIVANHHFSCMQARLSPNGRQVAFSQRYNGPYGELAIADIQTGKVRLLTQDHALALSPVWSPGGRSIYFASSRNGTLNVWKIQVKSGRLTQITNGAGDNPELDLSADGQRLLFTTLHANQGIAELNVSAAGPMHMLTTDPARSQFAPEFSPDGKYLAYFSNLKGAEHEAVWFAHADGSGAVELAHDARRNVFPTWSPHGSDLAYEAEGVQGQFFLRRVPVAGGSPETLYRIQRGAPHPRYCENGNILFVHDGQLEEINPVSGKIQIELKHFVFLNTTVFSSIYFPDAQCRSVAYRINPRSDHDLHDGIWVRGFQAPPRQIYRGWVVNVDTVNRNGIYFIAGSPDLNGTLWKINWDGSGLTRLPVNIPLTYNTNYQHSYFSPYFDVSPDGKKVAFPFERVLTENIGMLEWNKKK